MRVVVGTGIPWSYFQYKPFEINMSRIKNVLHHIYFSSRIFLQEHVHFVWKMILVFWLKMNIYHICFECPLFSSLRNKLFSTLVSCKFQFNNTLKHKNLHKYINPLLLLADLLCIKESCHVRPISRFLCDCLSLRSLYYTYECNDTSAVKYWPTYNSDLKLKALLYDNGTRINFYEDLLFRFFSLSLPVNKPLVDFLEFTE